MEVRTRTQAGKELGVDSEAMGEMLLIDLLPLACSACFFIEPKTTRPEMVQGTTNKGTTPLITN